MRAFFPGAIALWRQIQAGGNGTFELCFRLWRERRVHGSYRTTTGTEIRRDDG